MNELLLAIGGGIGTVIGGFTGWFFRRRYENATAVEKEADAESKQIDNDIKLSDYYKGMLDDFAPRYEIKLTELSEACEKKIADIIAMCERKESILQDEINLLKRKNKILTQENVALRRRIKELEV